MKNVSLFGLRMPVGDGHNRFRRTGRSALIDAVKKSDVEAVRSLIAAKLT